MRVVDPVVDPSNVVQTFVYNLLNVFDETRDLLHTLRTKEKRDHEHNLRAKGYPASRRVEYIDDEEVGSDEVIVTDKAAVTRQFEIGYQELGKRFAVGDVHTQTALQSHIIKLQNVLITTLLYGPTSSETIAHQLSNLTTASRAAGVASVDILAAQLQRQKRTLPPTSPSSHHPDLGSNSARAADYRNTGVDTNDSSTSTSLVRYHEPRRPREESPVNTTVLEWRGRPKMERSDTDMTSMTGPTSHGMKTAPHDLYCLYAVDLQRHRSQQLSTSIMSESVPYCPHCKQALHLSPGKAWEVCKNDDGHDRIFRVSNRFVVKCHRDGVDGQYSCVLCSDHSDVVSVCGDVKALIRHIWEEHSIGQLKHEEDITEVVDLPVDRRRDSGLGYSTSRSSRRSASLGPRRRRRGPDVEHEVEIFEFRSPRRGS